MIQQNNNVLSTLVSLIAMVVNNTMATTGRVPASNNLLPATLNNPLLNNTPTLPSFDGNCFMKAALMGNGTGGMGLGGITPLTTTLGGSIAANPLNTQGLGTTGLTATLPPGQLGATLSPAINGAGGSLATMVPFGANGMTMGVNPLAITSTMNPSALFPSMVNPAVISNLFTPTVPGTAAVAGAGPIGGSPVAGNLVGPAVAQPPAAAGGVNPNLQTRQLYLQSYIRSAGVDNPNLDVRLLQQLTGNQGISALALGYGAEIKAAAAEIAANPATDFQNTTNRSRNAAGLIPFMQFDNSGADRFLSAMMVYKNGTYNNGVVGQYNLANIVRTYEQRVGPLTPLARQAALSDERRGMGLVYFMMRNGIVDPAQEVDPATGASRNGFWNPQFNTAYLNAINAVRSGTLANDLALEASGRGNQTLGKVDGFLGANARNAQLPN